MDATDPIDEVRATYDAVARDYAEHFPATEPEAALDLAVIDHFVALLPRNALVLDAGCGTGRMSRYLADRGCRTEGVDLSPGMLGQARAAHPELPFTAGSLLDLGGRDSRYDAVLAWYSVIHTPDEQLPVVFAELARVLRAGGLILAAFQAGEGVRDVSGALRALGHDVRLPRWHRDVDTMARHLADAGIAENLRLVRSPVDAEADPQAFLIGVRH